MPTRKPKPRALRADLLRYLREDHLPFIENLVGAMDLPDGERADWIDAIRANIVDVEAGKPYVVADWVLASLLDDRGEARRVIESKAANYTIQPDGTYSPVEL